MRAKTIKNHEYSIKLPDIIEKLFEENIIDEFTKIKILNENRFSKNHPIDIISTYQLVDRRNTNNNFVRYLNADDLTEWLASKYNMEYIKINPLKINFESLISTIPQPYALRLKILPIKLEENTLTFAITDPLNLEWIKEVQAILKKEIKVKLASSIQVNQLLQEFYYVQKELKEITTSKNSSHAKLLKDGNIDELNLLLEKNKGKNLGQDDSAVVKIVDWLFNYAYNERASDIHLEPKKGLGQIRFRIDGKLHVVYKMTPDALLMIISRLKILGDMKIDEKRKPQDGRIKRFLDNGKQIEMRLSIIPTIFGEKMVMRIFDNQITGKDLDFIGFRKEDLLTWNNLINSAQGLILVTGPTGSGKTTTLYTSLNIVATNDINVCTAEDPIELVLDNLNQMQINHHIDVGFPEAIRSFLRQDPDVIMVGEIRDQETGEAAIQASLTGHLVFSTLHTNGALATIQRLVDLGLKPFLINSSLKAILAQRLVRKLCNNCKEKIKTPKNEFDIIKADEDFLAPTYIYKAKGCNECKNTGYQGRTTVYELVKYTDDIKKIVHKNIEITELREKTKGMFKTFRYNCLEKISSGITSMEEIQEIIY